MPAPVDFKPYLEAISQEINIVVGTMRDKGGKRFGRAFVIAGFMVFAAYFGVYMPPQKKSSRLQAQIDRARMLSEKGAKYKDLRDQLQAAYSSMPSFNDREQWLTNSVRDSVSAAGLPIEDFKPVREQEESGLIFQVSSVSLTMKFSEFYDWVLRIESAKPMMHLQMVELKKKGDNVGFNGVNCDIATVIPKTRFE